MKNFLNIFSEVIPLLIKDKRLLAMSTVPIAIGAFLYTTFGYVLYFETLPWMKTVLRQYLDGPDIGIALGYFFTVVLSVFFYFIIHWTFVLVVSLISAPFNDYICQLVQNHYGLSENSFSFSIKKLKSLLVNEIKKIALIIVLSICTLVIGFFPILTPVSLIITSILLSVSFLDYNWSILNYSFSDCLKFVRAHLFVLLFSGFSFLFLLSIPFLNLLVFPYAVVFYSILFSKSVGKNNCEKNIN